MAFGFYKELDAADSNDFWRFGILPVYSITFTRRCSSSSEQYCVISTAAADFLDAFSNFLPY